MDPSPRRRPGLAASAAILGVCLMLALALAWRAHRTQAARRQFLQEQQQLERIARGYERSIQADLRESDARHEALLRELDARAAKMNSQFEDQERRIAETLAALRRKTRPEDLPAFDARVAALGLARLMPPATTSTTTAPTQPSPATSFEGR